MDDSFFIVTKQILDYLFAEDNEKYTIAEQIKFFLIWRCNTSCGKKALILQSELDKFEKEWKDEPEVIAQARAFVEPQKLFIEDTKKDLKENMLLLAKNLSAFGKKIRILDNGLAKDIEFDIATGKLCSTHTIEKCYDILKLNKDFFDYIAKFFSVSS